MCAYVCIAHKHFLGGRTVGKLTLVLLPFQGDLHMQRLSGTMRRHLQECYLTPQHEDGAEAPFGFVQEEGRKGSRHYYF